MKGFSRNVFIVYSSAFILLSFAFISAECKTGRSRVPQSQSTSRVATSDAPTNVFYSFAKSLATEALSQFKETARRNPRLGFNITMLVPGLIANMTNPNNFTLPSIPGAGNFLGATTQLGIIGIKGGILGIKAAIVQAIVLILVLVFLLTGIAYFACNIGIISCSNLGGSLSNLGGGLGNTPLAGVNPFSRAGYDYHHNLQRSTSAVYNAIDDGQKKYT